MEAMHAELIGLDRRILVPATEEHPRNMGADLVELADGSLLLAYSRWLGGVDDYDGSKICGMTSTDGGDTWSGPFDMAEPDPDTAEPDPDTAEPDPDTAEPDPDTEAVRMPCFLRLKGGQLACFARYRSSVADTWVGKITCRDEARIADGVSAWSVPVRISPPPPGRHILLNNRALRLTAGPAKGRILLPVASPWPWEEEDARGSDIRSWCLLSDDDGVTWQSGAELAGPRRGLMEPYLAELADGRLRMWMRTQMDCQYESMSTDGGTTWTKAAPGPLVSPESPVAVARDPVSGLLLVIWNHNRVGRHTADRTPLSAALSGDEGESWFARTDLETDSTRSYSYPSVHFIGERGFVTYYENVDRRISLILRRFVLETRVI